MGRFVFNEGPRALFLCFWCLLQCLIFYLSFEIYNRSTHFSRARATLGMTLGIARSSAAVINFDCGLILFSVCRNLISVLRSTFLNDIVPFDKNILFHKTVAWSIVIFSSMAFLTGPGATGHALVLILFLMVTSSVECVRRKGFEALWFTHHLFILFFIILMFHGAFCFIHADSFILGSLLVHILERVVREVRARSPTSISKIVLHPPKVVEVQIKRELSGQYVFLNCPDISLWEWHPFTITSAPEEDYVSVHIRIVGDWTRAFARRLGCTFDDEQQFWIEELMSRRGQGGCRNRRYPVGPRGTKVITLPRVLIDGPYGSPSEDAFNYEIAVLVGAGIGVTPLASVLKHIWYSVMQPTKIITLRKVYFFWAFEWFQDLLIALEEQNMSDFLEIRSYLTGELDAEELNTVLMEARASAAMAAARNLRYAITGLRSPTYYDRPNFDKIFGELAQAHSREHGQVGVFFCGPKPLGKTLHRKLLKDCLLFYWQP
ncbi:MAG: FAD-binding domain-containing protein [Benniella sp.]|nr:MAG: FAD-binding domain-containing protein [Benniella sp.]